MYTFNPTQYGTVEVLKDGVRIATTTPSYAAQQYGYGTTPSSTESPEYLANVSAALNAPITGEPFVPPYPGATSTPSIPPVPTPETIQNGVETVVNGATGYGKTSYTGSSIVDYLNNLGKPSDYNSRATLAAQYGIQNYTGTAEQNTNLLNILRGQGGQIPAPQPSGTITPSGLGGGGTPLGVGGTTGTDTAGAIVAGAGATSKSIEDYIKMLTGQTTADQTTYDSLMEEVSGMIGGAGGRGAAQAAAEAAGGVPALKTALANVNAEILRKMAEYKALSTDIEGRPITMASIVGSQRAILNAQGADLGLLQATSLGLMGQLDAAQQTADRATTLKFQDIEDSINLRLQQLQLLEGQISKSEQIRADAIKLYLQDSQQQLADQKAAEKQKNSTLLSWMSDYRDAGITLNDTIESANKKITQNSQIYKKEIITTPAPTPTPASGMTQEQVNKTLYSVGLPQTIISDKGNLTDTQLSKLGTKGIPPDDAQEIMNEILNGKTLDEIRQWMRSLNVDPAVLDTFMTTLQGEEALTNPFK